MFGDADMIAAAARSSTVTRPSGVSKAAQFVDRNAVEPEEVRWTDDGHDVRLCAGCGAIRVRRDAAGIHHSRVRRDEPDQFPRWEGFVVRRGTRDERVYLLREARAGAGIPRACDSRRAYFDPGTPIPGSLLQGPAMRRSSIAAIRRA